MGVPRGKRWRGERGIALITAMLIMMLMSALMIGFTAAVTSDQKYRIIDRDRGRAFYAAHSGLEKLNADLASLFFENVAPTSGQIAALSENPPSIPDATFFDEGSSAYGATLIGEASGQITTGPYEGLIALKKTYELKSGVEVTGGGEAHLRRKVETVAIPVFQFGMFSDVDLSFSAADNFDFGGRVHTNRNLFLAQGGTTTSTLWLRDRVTAVGEVIRKRLSNGELTTVSGSTRIVKLARAPNSFRDLLDTEGSVSDGEGSSLNAAWPTISLTAYNGYLRNGRTGARRLDLPLITTGGATVDLVRRPAQNEDQTNASLFGERYFSRVSLRILLSDTAADITNMPTVTAGAPVQLDGNWRTTPPAGYTVDATHAPIARSPGPTLVGGNLPTVNGAVTVGVNQTIPLSPVLPQAFRVQTVAPAAYALRITSGSNHYVVTCTGKATSPSHRFTGCGTPSPLFGIAAPTSIASGATVAAALTSDTSVSTTTSATWSNSAWGTMVVNNVTSFTPNAFTFTVTAGGTPYTVHCAAKTVSQFIGCVPAGATAGTPTTVSASISTLDSGAGTETVNMTATAWTASRNEITVNSTLPFATNTFWVQNPASTSGTNVLVTCGGFAPPNQLIGCAVDTALSSTWLVTSGALVNAGVGSVGGFIKVEMQDTNKVWQDVTMEFLNHGIAGPNLVGKACGDPTPNAILRLQRLRDNDEQATWQPVAASTCSYSAAQQTARSNDYWPNALFDAREAVFRDASGGARPLLGGVMHYVGLDADNLARWFAGSGAYAGGSGPNALNPDGNGYAVYFSDRRSNRNPSGSETGEYGFEDVVNPLSSTGTPNGTLDTGEDFNDNGALDTYGQLPSYNGTYNSVPPGAVAPLTTGQARPTVAIRGSEAMVNRAVLFRRALKLVRGGNIGSFIEGLTVVSENPVYIHGDYNFNAAGYSSPNTATHAATSVVADAVTLLTNGWNDVNSFNSPYATSGRPRSAATYYRTAVISGKGRIFPRPTGAGTTFGTDGGAHSFLRFLEGGAGTVYYRGSMATFFYNRQALAAFKCCNAIIYDTPTRDYKFDIDFLDPAKLPPLTPVFRDLNALGFTQETRVDD